VSRRFGKNEGERRRKKLTKKNDIMGWHLPSLRWLNRPSYSSLRPRVYWIAIVVLVCCQDSGYCSNQAGVLCDIFCFFFLPFDNSLESFKIKEAC
jgi:hypothetical protein